MTKFSRVQKESQMACTTSSHNDNRCWLLLGINISKAQGPDKIPNIMQKTCANQLAPAMTTVFQGSTDSGKLPSDWLNANVSPVYKKGDIHLPENYRPVSLTCVSCNILEHIIGKHILDYLERNKILTSLNHGFRSGYSNTIYYNSPWPIWKTSYWLSNRHGHVRHFKSIRHRPTQEAAP